MSDLHNFPRLSDTADPFEPRRALIATAVILTLIVVLSFGPRPDRSKVVAGAPCSVLSENAISAVLGTPMSLLPTSGTVCQYVSTGTGAHAALFVVARHSAEPPPSWRTARAVPIAGIGDTAAREDGSLYVRYGSRAYTFNVVAASDPNAALRNEERLARMVTPSLVARNR